MNVTKHDGLGAHHVTSSVTILKKGTFISILTYNVNGSANHFVVYA